MAYDKKAIAERLKEIMNDSQDTIASKLNMTQGNVSKLLSGTQLPTTDTLYRISEVYGVSTDWILGLSEKKHIATSEVTYADVLKEFISLASKGIIWPYLNNAITVTGKDLELPEVTGFAVTDELIQSILYDWKRSVSTGSDIYEIWLDKRLKEYSEIPYIPWSDKVKELYDEVKSPYGVSADFLKQFYEYYEKETGHGKKSE